MLSRARVLMMFKNFMEYISYKYVKHNEYINIVHDFTNQIYCGYRWSWYFGILLKDLRKNTARKCLAYHICPNILYSSLFHNKLYIYSTLGSFYDQPKLSDVRICNENLFADEIMMNKEYFEYLLVFCFFMIITKVLK